MNSPVELTTALVTTRLIVPGGSLPAVIERLGTLFPAVGNRSTGRREYSSQPVGNRIPGNIR